MQMLLRMNKKLDVGWKMTNSSCQKCNSVTLADPNNAIRYYCPKCDKEYDFQRDQQDQLNQQNLNVLNQKTNPIEEQQDYFNQVIQETGIFAKSSPRQPQTSTKPTAQRTIQHNQNYQNQFPQKREQKSKDVSKKLGEKLLKGWTMLQQCCLDCNVPLMKSKKGQKLCLGCDKDYAKTQAEIQQQKDKIKQASLMKPRQQQKTKVSGIQSKPSQRSILSHPKIEESNQKDRKISSENFRSLKLIENIECKALKFLDLKMEKAIEQNDLGAVQRILSIVRTLRN